MHSFFFFVFSSDRRSAPIFSSDWRSGLQGWERSLSTVLRSNRFQLANFMFWSFLLPEGERESTWGAEGAEAKIEKNIQLHYPRPPSIKK